MSKSHTHSDKHAKKQPMMTPKEKKRMKQQKKRHEHEVAPPLIPHDVTH